jgi:hypothetical protein
MQELSITINNSVLPSVCSQKEQSEISVSSENNENDWKRPRPDTYDSLSFSGSISAELLQEPSSVEERPQSRRQLSVAFSVLCECVRACAWICALRAYGVICINISENCHARLNLTLVCCAHSILWREYLCSYSELARVSKLKVAIMAITVVFLWYS